MAIKVGFIGAGFASGVHQRNLSLDERAAIAAVYDVDIGRAGPLAVDSVDRLFERCDAVYITSPNRTHPDFAVEALEAGKHVFCEKPLAVDIDSALRVYEAAEKASTIFQVGHNRRFAPVYQRVRELCRAQPAHCAHVKMNRGELLQPAWTGDETTTGGFLYETPIHMFDMLRFQFGEIVGLEARESRRNDFSMLLEFSSGLHATFVTSADASWFFPYESLEIFGEYSTIRTAEMESLEYRLGLDQPTCSQHFANLGIEQKWGFAEGDRRFIDAILGRGETPVSALDGLRSVQLVSAAYESARSRRPILLELRP